MKCPHCHNEISNTAVRCKYCREPVGQEEKQSIFKVFLKNIKKSIAFFFSEGKKDAPCPWTLLDVFVLTAIIAALIFKDPFHLGSNVLRFLRLHFFIFTKEPKLFYYLTIYINTIILKGISVIFLMILVLLRRVSFWKTVVFPGKLPNFWAVGLPLYLAGCIIAQIICRMNPLVPNIPFNSVFIEAKIIGNIVIILSVLFVAPFVEEVLFRGFLYPALNRYMGIYPAIIFTSILFTFAHYPQIREEYAFMGVIFVLSVVITYAKARSGSTMFAILLHHIFNLVSVGMGFIDYLIFKY